MKKKVLEFYIERFMAILSFILLIGAIIGVIICIAAENFNLAWISSALALSSIAVIILKKALFSE